MWTGKTKTSTKIWASIGGRQIDELPTGTNCKGDAETTDYLRLTSPVTGWTKKSMVTYSVVGTSPVDPPPPDETDDPDFIIAGWNDGRTKRYIPE